MLLSVNWMSGYEEDEEEEEVRTSPKGLWWLMTRPTYPTTSSAQPQIIATLKPMNLLLYATWPINNSVDIANKAKKKALAGNEGR